MQGVPGFGIFASSHVVRNSSKFVTFRHGTISPFIMGRLQTYKEGFIRLRDL